MPDYKRKKVKRNIFSKKKRLNNDADIILTPKKEKKATKKKNDKGIVPENEIKVVRGKKFARSIRNRVLIILVAVLFLTYIILELVLPVSLYENIVNFTALIGQGKYPIDISGSTVVDCVSKGQYYYVLTDTSISAYSNGGKIIFDDMHGFAHPVIATSETRLIVYDQGGKTLYVYNLGGQINKLETKNDIIVANISRNGDIAVSTYSDNNYASEVNVYNNDLERIYTWSPSSDIINNVIVNPDGDRLAITTFRTTSVQYVSKMHIFDFDSGEPLKTIDLGQSPALSLTNTGEGVSVVTEDKYKYVHWTEYNTNEITYPCEINKFRKFDDELLLVFNRKNDRSDNTVFLISDEGTKTNEFKISNFITDIQYADGRIYYISDTTVNILDSKGNVLQSGKCNFGAKKLAVIESNSTAIITDTEIIETEIQKGDD